MPPVVYVAPSVEEIPPLKPFRKAAYALFGEDQTLLIPLRDGHPMNSKWKDLAVADVRKNSGHSLELGYNDIAVVCGPQSNSLAAIRFNTLAERDEFISRNPVLQQTLLSSSKNDFYVWIRLSREAPATTSKGFKNCDWICGQTYVHIGHIGSPKKHIFNNECHPAVISFEQIVWPDEVARAWAFYMVAKDYPMIIRDASGRPVLNDDHVVASYVLNNVELVYNPVTSMFYQLTPDSSGTPPARVYEEEIKAGLHQVLTMLRQSDCTKLLPDLEDEPAWATAARAGLGADAAHALSPTRLRIDTSLRHLTSLVDLLKVFAVKPFEIASAEPAAPKATAVDQQSEEAKGFEAFIETQLGKATGQNVTVEEIHLAYDQFSLTEGYARYSLRQFRDRLGEAVKRSFGIEKSHDLVRTGQTKRGFRNLELKGPTQPMPEAEATPRTDRTHRTPAAEPKGWVNLEFADFM